MDRRSKHNKENGENKIQFASISVDVYNRGIYRIYVA